MSTTANTTTQTDYKALPEAQQICPTTALRRATEEGSLFVDVREPGEIEKLAYVVPDIVHIPMSQFEQRYSELPLDRDLIMVCAVGKRSLKATYFLMYHGYTRVANMEDGMAKWAAKGFPVIGDPANAPTAAAGSCCAPGSSNASTEAPKSACTSGTPKVEAQRCA